MNSNPVPVNENKTFYLPGLNGIRAIAALLVVFSHLSLRIDELGFKAGEGINLAAQGVTMFFVLSGFLITFLLLKESDKKGRVSIRKFYIRRMLRIWPLYYLVFIMALVWIWYNNVPYHASSLFFYGFLMANIPVAFGGTFAPIVQFWSVGVEEQFYLFWPWLFKRKRKLPYIMLGIIFGYMALRFLLRVIENGSWYTFLAFIQFHCMALGGLGAWAIHHKRNFIKKFYHPVIQGICWALLVISLVYPIHVFSIIDSEIYAVIFWIIIINVSTNPKPLVTLENRWLNWMGSISYGIYIYHMFAITLVFALLKSWAPVNAGTQVFAYGLVLAVTLLVSHLSFRYFESWFLHKKSRFAIIESTNVKEQRDIHAGSNFKEPDRLNENPEKIYNRKQDQAVQQ